MAPPRLTTAPELHPSAWQDEDAAALKKKRTFRKFTFRGVDLDALLDLTSEQLMELVHARARRRFSRGLKKKGMFEDERGSVLWGKVQSALSTC